MTVTFFLLYFSQFSGTLISEKWILYFLLVTDKWCWDDSEAFGISYHLLLLSLDSSRASLHEIWWKIYLYSCEGSVPPFKAASFTTSAIPWFCLAKPGLLSQMLDLAMPSSGSEIQRCSPNCRRVARTCCFSFLLRSQAALVWEQHSEHIE